MITRIFFGLLPWVILLIIAVSLYMGRDSLFKEAKLCEAYADFNFEEVPAKCIKYFYR